MAAPPVGPAEQVLNGAGRLPKQADQQVADFGHRRGAKRVGGVRGLRTGFGAREGQEALASSAKGDVAVPGVPVAHLVLVEALVVLGAREALLNVQRSPATRTRLAILVLSGP